jgi:hypothetical protein
MDEDYLDETPGHAVDPLRHHRAGAESRTGEAQHRPESATSARASASDRVADLDATGP